ncbi:HAMP domain-containing sensor histidine kinase [Amnibacterium sp.]|uniref:HAMP domain-containing sensor histidine kinase n=1 Tax=Amnibacterium sp. TaxID=1872496 RepID=UPI003F7C08E5
MRGLSLRILLLSIGLVLATTVAAGLATVQLARASAASEQRSELVAQASLVTLQSARLATPRFLRRVGRGLDGSVLVVLDPDGSVAATTALGRQALVDAVAAAGRSATGSGEDVSTTVDQGGRVQLVEARPIPDGGAIVLTRPQTALTRTIGELVTRILVVLLVALVVAAVAAVWLSRRIARPLAATAVVARRLARGERGVPVPPDAPGEVGDVADALRALDLALAQSEGRQREFLLSVSHELRTPLTALRGYGEALADGLITGARVQEVGAVLVAETERVERFTADLLELARLEADDFSVVPTPIELGGIAAEAVEAWRGRADGAGITLRLEGFDTDVDALADARRVRQVLDGLVENALRATPAGGEVALVAVRRPTTAGVAVEDSGPGLSDDDLADAFTRGLLRERYRETRAVGTGLGLSIATRLASRMGGRVHAEHARTPPGARFVLELPRSDGRVAPR